jgi:DNA invertase Pin-like site-specific DNA recombinase
MEAQVQLIQISVNQFADLITERVDARFKDLLKGVEQTPPQEQDKFLTRKETADFFKISLYTIHDWMNKGIIKPYKAGNRTYFKRSELIEVLNKSNL